MKNLLITIICIISLKSQSQSLTLIDTTKQDFRKILIESYTKSTEKQQNIFKESLTDKKIQKEVITSYKEVNDEFIEQINKGFFVESPAYQKLLNKLLNQIAVSNPNYKQISNTQILLSFGNKPNAYAIGNDIVVILIPLIKSLANEQQLAFILAHEIAHNLLNHSYDGLVEYAELHHSKEIKRQTQNIQKIKYNKGEIASKLYKNIVYGKRKNSRKLEFQADSLGLILYKNAFKDYQEEAVVTLKNLGTLDIEKDSLIFNDYKRFFETEKFSIKLENFEQNKINNYNYDKTVKFWQVDSLKTHPDSEQRADFIEKQINNKESKNIEPTEDYQNLIKSSYYNHVLGLFVLENYGESLYQSLILLKSNPDDAYLLNLVYQNLLQLQKAQNQYTLNKYLDTSNPKYSESYNIFLNFFRQLRKSQLQEIINKYTT